MILSSSRSHLFRKRITEASLNHSYPMIILHFICQINFQPILCVIFEGALRLCRSYHATYRAEKISLYVVWWNLLLLLLTTSASACLQHSRNHVQTNFLSSVYSPRSAHLLHRQQEQKFGFAPRQRDWVLADFWPFLLRGFSSPREATLSLVRLSLTRLVRPWHETTTHSTECCMLGLW